MLQTQLLGPEAHDRFIAFNRQNSGAAVEAAFLAGARLRVFYRPGQSHRWVAAYAINTQPPFRCLSALPPHRLAELLHQHHLAEDNLVEITLLSRDAALGWQPGERDYYYRQSMLDALMTGCRHLLGGTTDPEKLKFQQIVLDQTLYEGDLTVGGQEQYGWVIYTSWPAAVYNACRYVVGQWFRALRRRRPASKTVSAP